MALANAGRLRQVLMVQRISRQALVNGESSPIL